MSHSTVAERYGRAIFELGVESGSLESLVDRIQQFAKAYETSADLRQVLENPLIDPARRDAILNDVAVRLNLSGLALNSVKLLARRRRLNMLPEIASLLSELSDERAGVVRATVTTAVPMGESFYERLKAELETMTQRRVVIERRQDPSLIAGVVTRIFDNTIDGSLKGRLSDMERQLRAS
ncbi:MAG TPA: ATP synthase F1 subunit delta [Polyangiaceae bacterium]|nr:ATP synthase F1 subunit delta [Polyangiaceae bacterium]